MSATPSRRLLWNGILTMAATATPHELKSTIVFVDDDPIFLELVSNAVRRERPDLEVLTNLDATSAIASLRPLSKRPLLLVCDINMPNRDGVELLADVAREWPRLTIAFASGAAPAIVKSAALLAETSGLSVAATFRKPLDFAAFGRFIRGFK